VHRTPALLVAENVGSRVERLIDFASFLKNAKNPMTKKYLDKKLFKEYSIEYGDIIWNDYEMCFPIWDLHEGKI
jgi:hypothetical protein